MAIVNAWNRNFIPWSILLPQGVSGAMKRHAGYAPFRELARAGVLPLGGAVVTCAGRLPFRAIIHVAGIGWLWTSSEESIRTSVQNALALAAHLLPSGLKVSRSDPSHGRYRKSDEPPGQA